MKFLTPSVRTRLTLWHAGDRSPEYLTSLEDSSGPMSPRLSLTPRNKAQLAATCRYSVRAPARNQVVENAGEGGDLRRELKILVSAVQSRPCPPSHLQSFQ